MEHIVIFLSRQLSVHKLGKIVEDKNGNFFSYVANIS